MSTPAAPQMEQPSTERSIAPARDWRGNGWGFIVKLL